MTPGIFFFTQLCPPSYGRQENCICHHIQLLYTQRRLCFRFKSHSHMYTQSGNESIANLSIVECFSLPQWNNHGYDIAKWFAAKFTHISPVWLQLKRK